MPLADYYQKSALAAAQVIAGFDESRFRERLDSVRVGISIGESKPEGRLIAELLIRIIARLYPNVVIAGPTDEASKLRDLAASINPLINLASGEADVVLRIGSKSPEVGKTQLFIGSDNWVAHFSPMRERSVGSSMNPFGSGAAACIGASNLFRQVFIDPTGQATDPELAFSTLDLEKHTSAGPDIEGLDLGEIILVGAGAIGQAAIWALVNSLTNGILRVIDHEAIELSNIQRYVLTVRADDGRPKVDIPSKDGQLKLIRHQLDWAGFVSTQGYRWEQVLVAVDSSQARRDIQSSLPEWIANSWTQPGDLGVSTHVWRGEGACIACLYLPAGKLPNQDEIVGQALGLSGRDEIYQVRQLLYTGAPVPSDLLDLIADRLQVERENLEAFATRPIRDLYVEGVCGGDVIPMQRLLDPNLSSADVHVPLAHQSAFAGILLSSRLVAKRLRQLPALSSVTRINVLRPMGEDLTQPVRKDSRGLCICQDPKYQEAYAAKYA